MTTNDSGKLNMGGVAAMKEIARIPPAKRTSQQSYRLAACLTALAHQPKRWYSYQDWGSGGPVSYLAELGIEFFPTPDKLPTSRSWYDGCECDEPHWREDPLGTKGHPLQCPDPTSYHGHCHDCGGIVTKVKYNGRFFDTCWECHQRSQGNGEATNAP